MKPNQKKIPALLLCSVGLLWAVAGVNQAYASTHMQRETVTFNSLFKSDGMTISEYCSVTLQGNTQIVEASCYGILKPTVTDLQRRYPLVAFHVIINGESLNTI
ncbi:hypothetical protein PGT2_g00012 [Escherichia phage PGT2]|uniref:Uncharacterized protein n=1 Tax=Escherichia phage PGT2 TaxID=2047782 RepID=A0A2D2W309_9CAUD|nr:hypothetical protein HOS43_gp12 [Escherichia phage PGT2]ATS92430.1 hypothetical protein PGT2_g00012 [Escherichia phage PGT2]